MRWSSSNAGFMDSLDMKKYIIHTILIVFLVGCSQQNAQQNSVLLSNEDTAVVKLKDKDFFYIIHSSADGAVMEIRKNSNEKIASVLYFNNKLGITTIRTDQSGEMWEVADMNGDGVPEGRTSHSNHLVQIFQGGEFKEKKSQ